MRCDESLVLLLLLPQQQMLYLGMGGRCGEDAGRLFVVKPRRHNALTLGC
jgi:hypothetical protein